MALRRAVRHVWLRLEAEPAQRLHQDGQPGQAISIEVAQDEDRLPGSTGAIDAGLHDVRVRQGPGIVQPGARIVEARGQLRGVHGPAPRQHAQGAGRQTAPLSLLDGGRGERMRRRHDPVVAGLQLGHEPQSEAGDFTPT